MLWTVHLAYEHESAYINVEADSEDAAIGKAVRQSRPGEPVLLCGWWTRTDQPIAR